jgi:hypothetical protein
MTPTPPSTAMAASVRPEHLEDIILNFALREGVVNPERQVAHVISRQLYCEPSQQCFTHQVIPTAQVENLAAELGVLVYREYTKQGPVKTSGLRGSDHMLLLYCGGPEIIVVHLVRGLLVGRSMELRLVQQEQTRSDIYRADKCPGYRGTEKFTLAPYRFFLATDFDQVRYEREIGKESSQRYRERQEESSREARLEFWGWSPLPS